MAIKVKKQRKQRPFSPAAERALQAIREQLRESQQERDNVIERFQASQRVAERRDKDVTIEYTVIRYGQVLHKGALNLTHGIDAARITYDKGGDLLIWRADNDDDDDDVRNKG